MKRFILLFFLVNSIFAFGQRYTLSGRVFSSSGEAIVGAVVTVQGDDINAVTDNYGYFNLILDKGIYKLKITNLAYRPESVTMDLRQDTVLFITMIPENYELEQVEVTAGGDIIESNNISSFNIPVRKFNRLPVLIGEKDLFKGIQTLPGVQPGAEGTSQLNIRGSSPDQNLVLIDDMPIYYVSHLYGFVSTFNSNAVKSLKVYKGAFPAKYNDMSSSVIDIVLKDGDMRNRHFSIDANPLALSLSLDGYIVKDKISMTAFYRRTFIDGLLALGRVSGIDIPDNYVFYDFNFKIRYKINDRNTVYVSFFDGRDNVTHKDFYLSKDSVGNILSASSDGTRLTFGNRSAALRWFSILSDRLVLNNVLYTSDFAYNNVKYSRTNYKQTDSILKYFNIDVLSGITQVSDRLSFNYFLSKTLRFNFGVNTSFSKYNAVKNSNYYDYLATLDFKRVYFDTLMSVTVLAPYFELMFDSEKFKFSVGLTNNNYFSSSKNFYYIEPRVKLSYLPDKKIALQLSYSLTHQYNHLLQSSAINMPSDLYLASGDKVPPVTANIYDAALMYTTQKWTASFSVYYKEMDNLIRYLPGVDLITMAGDWTDYIDIGTGQSYGLEILLEKKYGKFTGWLSYTYSRSYRQFVYTNSGQRFYYRYDRPHILSLVSNYKLSKQLSVSLLWTLYSGSLLTIPSHSFTSFFPNLPVAVFFPEYYPGINNVRAPAYHRADIALNYHKYNSHSYWSVVIYNLYNRLNPTYLTASSPGYLQGICLFPIMPFIGYKYQLDW